MPAPRHRARHLRLVLPAALAAALAACSSTSAQPPLQQHSASPPVSPSPSPTPQPSGSFSPFVPIAGQPPVSGHPWYLAIGDSVTSGFTVDPTRLGTNSAWALQLQGLLAASGRPWTLYDVACPSERTDTYYTLCPARSQIPFLATTSQHDAAMAAITAHRADLRAVFVDLGSNDLLHAQRTGESLPATVAALRTSLTRIVAELQRAAPRVPVILCNFYDPLANLAPTTLPQLDQVNAMVAQVAAATGARLADFRDAINTVRSGTDPTLCTYVDCAHGDVHPTIAGHLHLARVALAALLSR